MTTLFALAALLVQDAEPWFPGKPGTVLTFRRDGKETQTTLASIDLAKITAVDTTDDSNKYVPLTAKSAVGAGDDDDRRGTITVFDEKGVRIYRRYGNNHAGLALSVPLDVKDGSSWEFRRVVLSCGFMGIDVKARAKAEKVTVPAGTFDAIRIDVIDDERVTESLWIVRGMGIVKSGQGEHATELVKIETPK